MNRAVFLDRDGTINVDKNYLYKIEDFEFLPGVVESLKTLSEAGFLLIILTNQSGIARGYYAESDYAHLNSWMNKELEKAGVVLAGTYYCPHLPDAQVAEYRLDCECRKPKLGMFWKAVSDFNVDLKKSFAIGDKDRDVAICKSTAVKGIRLYSGATAVEGNLYRIQGGLREAADLIIKEI